MTDVIIISTKPGKPASYYAEILAKQTVPAGRLIIVRAPGCSAETDGFQASQDNIEIVSSRFDAEGYLLTLGVRASSGEDLLFLNEDVLQVPDDLIERLAGAVSEEMPMAFARTLPGEACTRIRDAYQAFLNPEEPETRTRNTLFRKGFLQFYTGGSAVMITREALREAGGFEAEIPLDPFSVPAAELFYLGRDLFYAADTAVVRKPESASPAAVFHRAFDLAAGMRAYAQIFGLSWRYAFKDEKRHRHPVILMTRAGFYTAKFTFSAKLLLKKGRFWTLPALLFLMLLELSGDLFGGIFHLLPTGLSRYLSGKRSWFSD